jgi:hypothetical protein
MRRALSCQPRALLVSQSPPLLVMSDYKPVMSGYRDEETD